MFLKYTILPLPGQVYPDPSGEGRREEGHQGLIGALGPKRGPIPGTVQQDVRTTRNPGHGAEHSQLTQPEGRRYRMRVPFLRRQAIRAGIVWEIPAIGECIHAQS